MLLADKSEKP